MSDKVVKKWIRILASIFMDVVIVLVLVRVFSYGYNFCYQVFTDNPASLTSTEKVKFVVAQESSTSDIIDDLCDQEIVDDKYVMLAKVYLSSYHGKMLPGTYMLSASMPPSEIMKILTGNDEEEKPEESQES